MKSCLVVDDSKVVRKVVRKIVEGLGFAADEAYDGANALEQCQDNKYDVIMLDWNMPIKDGMQFFREFKELPNSSETVVIFCTTENEFSKIQEAIQEGAKEYIMKPFDEEIVRNKFQQTGLL